MPRACRAAAEFDRVDRRYPLPSWNDLAVQVGIELEPTRVGDLFEESIDLQAYWPEVTVAYESCR